MLTTHIGFTSIVTYGMIDSAKDQKKAFQRQNYYFENTLINADGPNYDLNNLSYYHTSNHETAFMVNLTTQEITYTSLDQPKVGVKCRGYKKTSDNDVHFYTDNPGEGYDLVIYEKPNEYEVKMYYMTSKTNIWNKMNKTQKCLFGIAAATIIGISVYFGFFKNKKEIDTTDL